MDGLRSILADLLNPEKAAESTKQMKVFKSDPQLLPSLMNIALSDGEPAIRQMAAVILRKETSKRFSGLNQSDQAQLKEAIIKALTNEQHPATWSALAEVAACLLRKNASWPEFFQLVQAACQQSSARGAELLARMSSSAPQVIRDESTASVALDLIASCFAKQESETLHQALRAYDAIITELTDGPNVQKAKNQIQSAVKAIEHLIQDDQIDWAVEGFQMFQALLDSTFTLVPGNSVQQIAQWAAKIFCHSDADPSIRTAAGNFLSALVTSKSKSVKKAKMTRELIELCFPILIEDTDEDDEDDEEECPRSSALQLLDTISIKLPNTEVLPVILTFAQTAANGDFNNQRAALSALSVICEGCASPLIEGGHVSALIKFACTALQADSPALRGSALYAIGQFAEQMVGAVTEFAPEILNIVTKLLEQPTEVLIKHSQLERGLYCIEQLVDTLDEEQIEQLLPSLLTSLARFLAEPNTEKCQTPTIGVACLGSIIAASQEAISPHLQAVVQMLQKLLPGDVSNDDTDASTLILQSSALDTLATLASSAGEAFVPIAKDSLSLAGKLVTGEADPDIRRAALNLSCAVVSLPNCPPEMLAVVPRLLECLMETLKSSEGIGVKFVGDADENDPDAAADAFEAIEDLDDSQSIEGEEGDEEIEHFTVENSYLEEKHSALTSIIRMAQKIPNHIAPQSEAMYKECLALCDFVNEEIRKFSCSALMHLSLGMFKISNNDEGLKEAVKKALEMIQQDTDNGVALLLMAELSDVIDKYGKPLFTREIMECVINALKGELICMMEDDDEEEVAVEEEEASEIERELLDGAGELLVAAARVDPQGVVSEGLVEILTVSAQLMKKPDSGSKACALGILADFFDTVGSNSAEGFIKQLLPAYQQFTTSDDDNVRNNATFGIGVLIATGGQTGASFINQALSSLPLNENKNMQVKDNVTGAVARMFLVADASQREELAKQFLTRLPLTEDHAEWRVVLNAIELLVNQGNQEVMAALPELSAHCLNSVNNLNLDIHCDKRTVLKIGEFIQKIHDSNQALFGELKQKTPEKVWTKLNKAATA